MAIRYARPPLIGIVTHELRAEPEPAWASAPGRRERDLAPARLSLRLTYVQAISEAGGLPVVLPAHGFADDAHALLDRIDGLLFSGGPDYDPATYGQPRHPELGPDVDRVADDYELAMLAAARERDLPVLGICRGMQGMNIVRGGTLHQHILDHRQRTRRTSPLTPRRSPPARRCTASPAAAGCMSTASTTRRSTASGPDWKSSPGRRTARSRRCTTLPPAFISASSGTPSCSRTAPSTRRWSRH